MKKMCNKMLDVVRVNTTLVYSILYIQIILYGSMSNNKQRILVIGKKTLSWCGVTHIWLEALTSVHKYEYVTFPL